MQTMVMMMGSKGCAIESLQELLKNEGLYIGEITGVFDDETKSAVAAFQAREFLDITGVADERTQMILAMRNSISQ